MPQSWSRRSTAALFALLLLLGVLASSAQADIRYISNEIGYLVGVVEAGGDAVTYRYDAVGNLLSIGRQSAAQVSIIEFSPDRGPIGTTVTIYGTAFSATPSQNTVTFNGLAGTVTSASATQLTATVPAGATTGTIAVTAPAGSASSAAPFTVTTTTDAPTIISFTPGVGPKGTAVAITGTNFQTATAQNAVTFNTVGRARVDSATPTTLATSVPERTSSGRIAVATPYGTAVSADDFFVTPSPYTAADVEVTGRMQIGGSSLTVSLGTPNRIALVVFDGTAGQRISLGVTGVTITQSDVKVYEPYGTSLTTLFITGSNGLDPPVLPATASYTILVDPRSTYTGNMTLTLSEELTGTITVDGPPVTVSTTRPAQRARWTFAGTAGQVLHLGMTGVTITQSDVSILKPDGSILNSAFVLTSGKVIDTAALPTTGTYAILIDPRLAYSGSMTLTLSYQDVTGSVTIGGPAQTVTITRPGQNARVTFEGTTGQSATVRFTNNAIGCVDVALLQPDGSTLTSSASCVNSFNIPTQTLPTTGTYTITINPRETATGSIAVSVTSP